MAAIYSNGGNRWNIIGFNFTKRDALSSVYKISMCAIRMIRPGLITSIYNYSWKVVGEYRYSVCIGIEILIASLED
jgi:hypothetical protein